MRRLYVEMMRSKLLYGAAFWAADLLANRRSLLLERRMHRVVAIRVVRGFRTISAAAATVLAGFPSFELQTLRCRETYLRTRGLTGSPDTDASVSTCIGSGRKRLQGATIAMTRRNTRLSIARRGWCRVTLSPRK